jgi:hypothetical protein
MKRALIQCVAAGLATVLASATGAATFLVDDTRSTVLDANLPLQWRSLSPAGNDHQVQGLTRVQIKLDTRAWVGKFVRMYMALPAQPGGAVQVRWQAQGPLLSGQLSSGQRGLVWSGSVPTATLEDVFTVTVQTDGRMLTTAQLLRFYFEVDVP